MAKLGAEAGPLLLVPVLGLAEVGLGGGPYEEPKATPAARALASRTVQSVRNSDGGDEHEPVEPVLER